MNLAPVRGSYFECYCGASPANDMRPFQGQRRNCHVIWLKTAQRFFWILNTLAINIR